jgi:hypothetical protein
MSKKQRPNISLYGADGTLGWILEGYDRQSLAIAATKAGALDIVHQAYERAYEIAIAELDNPISLRYVLSISRWQLDVAEVQDRAKQKLAELGELGE